MNSLNLLENNVVFGEGSLNYLEQIISGKGYKNILLISGKSSFTLSSADTFFEKLKEKTSINRFSYSGNALNISTVDSIFNKLSLCGELDLIIGIGGGSVLDLAKLLSLLYSNKLVNTELLISNKQLENKVDLILIPTTSGSGSEATSFAVVYKNNHKYSISSPKLNISNIILDPLLLKNIPSQVLKISILDSLSQAIESFWSVNSNELSRTYAKLALEILAKNLNTKRTYKNISDFLLASHFAGKAINITKTTAPHALSYFLTSNYLLPHGFSVALFLIEIINFNYEVDEHNCLDIRSSTYVKNSINEILEIFSFESIKDLQNLVFSMLFELRGELKEIIENIIKDGSLENIIKYINVERLTNNPRLITQAELEIIISHSLKVLQKLNS